MKGIVTGGAGFIGSHLVDKLLSLGWEVIVIDNESAQSNEEFFWNKNSQNYKLDICDYDKINPLFKGVDFVFHLAAESRIQPAIKNPIQAAQTNVVGTCNILQSAREHGIKKVLFSSTSSAYGLINKPPLCENMPKDCLNPYSVTKCSGEELCTMYTKLFGVKTVIFRYFNVYGDRQPLKGQYAPVVGIFLRQVKNSEPMTIVGDGLQRRDFTHVSDVVEANILAACSQSKLINGQIINIGTGQSHSVLELSKMIGKDFVHIPTRVGESKETLADITRAQEWLNWSPKIFLEDWINEQNIFCD
jgi:UDP-glucose 4-epimerase